LGQNLPPITLIFLPENVGYAEVQSPTASCFPDRCFHRPKVLFNLVNDRRYRVLVEIDNTFKIQFLAQNIKENILAVAFVKFSDGVDELAEHGEILT
jgi:hypothetical protein